MGIMNALWLMVDQIANIMVMIMVNKTDIIKPMD